MRISRGRLSEAGKGAVILAKPAAKIQRAGRNGLGVGRLALRLPEMEEGGGWALWVCLDGVWTSS